MGLRHWKASTSLPSGKVERTCAGDAQGNTLLGSSRPSTLPPEQQARYSRLKQRGRVELGHHKMRWISACPGAGENTGKPIGENFGNRTCTDAAAQQHVLSVGLTLA